MDKSDRLSALKEMHRVLKSGGIISITEFGIRPGRELKYSQDAKITGEYGTMIVKKEVGTEWFRSHNFKRDELESLLREGGFVPVEYSAWEGKTFHGNIHPGHHFIARKI